MKKDIDFPKVEGISVCAIPENNGGDIYWQVHIINNLDEPITNVLVAARGYGKQEKEEVKTSELRHYFEEIGSLQQKPIEVVASSLIGLSNQYWVSFYIGKTIFDKKFIFLPDTLIEKNLTLIPVLEKQGILIN